MKAALVLASSLAFPLAAAAQPEKQPEPEPEWEMDLGGRLFVRDTYNRVEAGGDDIASHTRALDLARVFLTYDRERLRVAFEVDFAGDDAEIKDTFIRLEPVPWLRLQAGRFKVPMSVLGLSSRWSLPATERGILSELEAQDRDLPFAGVRGDGVAVQVRPAAPLSPRFTLATFQSPLATEDTPVDPADELTQDVHARASIEPFAGLELATAFALVQYQLEPGVVESQSGFAMGSLEAQLEARFVRVWAEAFAGESFLPQPSGAVGGRFTAARLLVAVPLPARRVCMRTIEPFAIASVLDPTDDVDRDRLSELGAGVNLEITKHWRLQLEADRRIAGGSASPIADATVIRLQLGATFEEQIAQEETRP